MPPGSHPEAARPKQPTPEGQTQAARQTPVPGGQVRAVGQTARPGKADPSSRAQATPSPDSSPPRTARLGHPDQPGTTRLTQTSTAVRTPTRATHPRRGQTHRPAALRPPAPTRQAQAVRLGRPDLGRQTQAVGQASRPGKSEPGSRILPMPPGSRPEAARPHQPTPDSQAPTVRPAAPPGPGASSDLGSRPHADPSDRRRRAGPSWRTGPPGRAPPARQAYPERPGLGRQAHAAPPRTTQASQTSTAGRTPARATHPGGGQTHPPGRPLLPRRSTPHRRH